MSLQPPIIVTVRDNPMFKGYQAFISDKKTVYNVYFRDDGSLSLHACKLRSDLPESWDILFDHAPDRGININLKKLEYSVWGLSSSDIKVVYSLFKTSNKLNGLDILREQLAALEHEQWADLTEYMLNNIDAESITRWKKQIDTPYAKLSEEEKESDRVWVDRVLEILMKSNISETDKCQ